MDDGLSAAHDRCATLLTALSKDRRELFALRLERWWPDLVEGLQAVYGDRATPAVALRLALLAATAYRDRDPDLHRLDLVRSLQPDWLQQPHMVGYAAYTERFAGDLRGVERRPPYLKELGVTYLHLMPLLRPRAGDGEGGYAVADYREVRPDLGTRHASPAPRRSLRRPVHRHRRMVPLVGRARGRAGTGPAL